MRYKFKVRSPESYHPVRSAQAVCNWSYYKMEIPTSSIPWTWSQLYTETVDAFEADAANLFAQSSDFWDFLGVNDDIPEQTQNETQYKTSKLGYDPVTSFDELCDFMSLDNKPKLGQFVLPESHKGSMFKELDDILPNFSRRHNNSYLETLSELKRDLNPPHSINVTKPICVPAAGASPIFHEFGAKRDCGLFGVCPFDGLAHPSLYLGHYFTDDIVQMVKPLPKRVIQLRGQSF